MEAVAKKKLVPLSRIETRLSSSEPVTLLTKLCLFMHGGNYPQILSSVYSAMHVIPFICNYTCQVLEM